jgi:hypothetical protein
MRKLIQKTYIFVFLFMFCRLLLTCKKFLTPSVLLQN